MQIVELTRMNGAALEPLLHEQAECWDRVLHWDYAGSAQMIREYIDSRQLAGFAVLEAGRVVGYAFLAFDERRGQIGSLFVSSQGLTAMERRRIEIELAHRCIETLQSMSEVREIEAQFPAHPGGTFVHNLQLRDLQRHCRRMMSCTVEGLAAKAAPRTLPEEFEVRNWSDLDYQPAARLIASAYMGHADNMLGGRYRTASRVQGYLERATRFAGCGVFDAASSCVVVHRASGELAGLLLAAFLRPDVGHIVQVCSEPAVRRMGLGRALVHHAAERMSARGAREVTLAVGEANFGAIAFLEEAGFRTFHSYDVFTWERCPAHVSLYAQSGAGCIA